MKRLFAALLGLCLLAGSVASAQQLAWWKSIQQVGVTTGGALSCSYTPITNGMQSVAYTGATPVASGGSPAYTFSETGTLPSGLSINSSTGIISGTPTANGSFPTIQVKVTDSASTTANCGSSFTLVIATTLACSNTPVTTGTQGTAYTGSTPSASGGTPTYVFSETGSLPSGLSINSATGIISGTPGVGGSFPSIQISVTDSLSFSTACGSPFTLVITPSGSAMVTPMLGASGAGAIGPSTTVANFVPYYQSNANGANYQTTTGRGQPIAIPGTISNFTVRFPNGVGAGQYSIVFIKASAGVLSFTAQALTCTITTGTICSDNINSFSVVAGDIIAIEFCPGTLSGTTCTPGTAPTASTVIQYSSLFTSANNGEGFLVFPFTAAASATVANFFGLNGLGSANTTESLASGVVAAAGVIDKLYVQNVTAPGAGKTFSIAICHNGSCNGTPVCTVTGASGVGALSCNDTLSAGVSLAVGDTLSIMTCPGTISAGVCAPTGSPATTAYVASVRWVPTIPGQALISMISQGGLAGSNGTTFGNLNGSGITTVTEVNAADIAGATSFTIKNFIVVEDVVPGGSATRALTARANSAAAGTPGTIGCTITAAITTCSDNTNSYSTTTNDLLDWRHISAGLPAAVAYMKIGAVVTVP